MSIVTIALIALFILGLVAAIAQKLAGKDANSDQPVVPVQDCGTCDGNNSKCEQECMLEAAVKEIEYFDDEELDAFRGRASHDYSEAEAEQFAEILYTMQPEEVAAWNRSLILRGINIPDQIRDEMLLLLSDDRQAASNNRTDRQ